MHIHHAYIGIFLIVWSILAINLGIFVIGEFSPWLAWGGLGVGTVLLAHDLLCHFRSRKKRR